MAAPPQLDLAKENYEVAARLEQLSLGAFAKVNDFRRKDLDASAIVQLLKDSQILPSAQQP
ncbi:hypothetical protein [Cupriavidus sp. D39]|uniref:hypothetical protein n=1 Tax=Cupriavidus sp. D39 TaxID=2997877 RepID=UPI0022701B30|nr:hypothetical protein [Cupriavidus sp. D39]MCY0852689.1 hypothetical protein [Cupriavidus sp. D39]